MIQQILLVLSLWSNTAGKISDSGVGLPTIPAYVAADKLKTGAEQTDLYYPLLAGKSIGLVVNQTSRMGNIPLPDALLNAGFHVEAIFAPEHGFRGDADAGATIANGKDTKTGLPVISIYGKKKKPAASDLKEIDIMIFDIQDVGARFYTYISTLHYIMEACAENDIPLIILDRPNPNGFYVDGPVLRSGYESFVGMHPVPIVHGMTVGEYGKMINGEGWLPDGATCDLTVIPCAGYDHTTLYELPVPPSPNLRDMRSVYLYPTLCLFEGTEFSVGRGTPDPFTLVGSPHVRGYKFSFVPQSGYGDAEPLFKGETCYGISLAELPIDSLTKGQLDMRYMIAMYKAFNPDETFFREDGFFNKLAGNDLLAEQIRARLSDEEIRLSWSDELTRFKAIRKKYLLYPDFEL